MGRKTRRVLTSIVPLALAFTCQAQMRLATVNMDTVLAGTREGHRAISELNTKRSQKAKEFEQKQKEILALQDQLNQGANTLADAAKSALFAAITAKKKTVQREMEDAQTDLEIDEQKILQQLGSKILAVVQRYAHDNSYSLVVDLSNSPGPVLYASADIDITKAVIDLYDKASADATPGNKPPR